MGVIMFLARFFDIFRVMGVMAGKGRTLLFRRNRFFPFFPKLFLELGFIEVNGAHFPSRCNRFFCSFFLNISLSRGKKDSSDKKWTF